MDWANFALAMVGTGLAVLGLGFTVWARRVDDAKDALNRVSDSIREVVELRLAGIVVSIDGVAQDIKQIRKDVHEFAVEQRQHGLDIATLKERNRDK